MPPVSVYIPCHDYADFVERAIASVLDQTYEDWELIVVDDGSTDGSWDVIRRHAAHERTTVLRNPVPRGLRGVANQALELARGTYVLRLDADDRLHPRCLEILVRTAEEDPGLSFVFSDYFYVDDADNVLGVECLPNGPDGYQALTFPPHGACSLVRRDLFEEIGGYADDLERQDGHELWIKLLRAGHRHAHVSLPLFYYRQHGSSLSSDARALLADRGALMRRLAEGHPGDAVAVVPVKNTYDDLPDIPFRRYEGVSLLEGAIAAAAAVESIREIVVTTDCDRVAGFVASTFPEVVVLRRPEELCTRLTTITEVLEHVVEARGWTPDTVLCLLSVHTPRRTPEHVQRALDAFNLYPVDSVVSVVEERGLIYQLGTEGLRPLNESNEGKVRLEREAVYVDTGAVRVFPVANLALPSMLGTRVGHSLVDAADALQIKSPHDLRLLDGGERTHAA